MKRLQVALIAVVGAAPVLAVTPNVVIFYADDMGIGDVGCYGCKDIRTPNIDSLASRGVRFTNYYSAAPICSPSRAALLTGRYPIRAGVPTNAPSSPGGSGMPSSEVTIAELARSRGYATALIGKWHLGFSPGTRPNDQGFDEFFGHHAGCLDYYSHMFYWHGAGIPPHHDLYRNCQEIHEDGAYLTDLIAREAVRFIDAHAKAASSAGEAARPFLLYVPFNAPHYPMMAPARLRKMYAALPAQRAIYAAMVTGMDEAIGRIMDAVKRAGTIEDTFVFFASDNGATIEMEGNGGGGSNGPYRAHKFSVFEGGIHMPAILSRPGHLPQGETRDRMVCAIDLFPTVAETIGAPLPADRKIDGKSWGPLLKDAKAAGHDVLFWQHHKQYAVHEGNWKLCYKALATSPGHQNDEVGPEDKVFLADLKADPGETRNLARDHPDIVKRLTKLHEAWASDVAGSPH